MKNSASRSWARVFKFEPKFDVQSLKKIRVEDKHEWQETYTWRTWPYIEREGATSITHILYFYLWMNTSEGYCTVIGVKVQKSDYECPDWGVAIQKISTVYVWYVWLTIPLLSKELHYCLDFYKIDIQKGGQQQSHRLDIEKHYKS